MNRTCDTNTVQTLYILVNRPDKINEIENRYPTYAIAELYAIAKKISRGQPTNLYVTPLIMKEIEMCERKLPGIIQFTRENFYMKTTTSTQLLQIILDLEDEYLQQDVSLNDSTRELQSAIQIEKKDGLPSRSDAHIVAENNVLNGQPLFTLNEKHLICIKSSDHPNKPQRSAIILKKNENFVYTRPLHKVAKRNLKRPISTTFKVKNINKSKEDLILAMIREL